jgi:hypothetical protein
MPEAILNAGKPRKVFELIKWCILWILVEKRDICYMDLRTIKNLTVFLILRF